LAHGTLSTDLTFASVFAHPLQGIDHFLDLPLSYVGGLLTAILVPAAFGGGELETGLAMTLVAPAALMANIAAPVRAATHAIIPCLALLHEHAHRVEYLGHGGVTPLVLGVALGTASLLAAGSLLACIPASQRVLPRIAPLAFTAIGVTLAIAALTGGQ